ncbi:ferrodoxin-nadp(+) reductase [Moniliophthora roreri MCA 2997]|uniref:NADPH:adrenodoxin oxidoreductase, mitochondrial n=2 Tax=Moniliophthora roreri TaxID=221103 RepID=V2XK65_MONRO|nr:ferrodoxin-nadp(+) reductase [Moniliophthora roreri MCA 2997]KAI3607940.1 ferrodoxin-nadp(+) reductase [Moniliophthora roreri]
MKLGIVGGGPSGFYVASRILSQTTRPLRIDVYDRLWAPHGLVRYGVAPDHPEVKNCTHKFDGAARDPRLRFFGNVNVGNGNGGFSHNVQLPVQSLLNNYTHLLLSTGCPNPNLHPALPPRKDAIVPAIDVVHWYTAHPSNPSPPPLDRVKHVSVIGLGNVSLDVARILLMSPEELAVYDVPEEVLDMLRRSKVEHVSIIGRRGPLEAAFTTKELREMMDLKEASMVPLDPALLEIGEGRKITRQQSRIVDLLKKGSKNKTKQKKGWSLEFYRNPLAVDSSQSILTLSHTEVDPNTGRAIPTGITTQLSTDLIITSLGFHGESFLLPSSSSETSRDLYSPTLGHLLTVAPGNRISSPQPSGHILKNIYASGWAAMGAKGVLAATMMDAYSVVDGEGGLLDSLDTSAAESSSEAATEEELLASNPNLDSIPKEVEEGLKKRMITTYKDWKVVDAEETRRAREGKERERMTSWEEVKNFLGSRTDS